MKKFLLLAIALIVTALGGVQAEEAPENYVSYPYAFIGLQGGGQTTLTDYNNWKLFTPTASVSFGVQFTPVFGARLHVNGLWNKGGVYGNGYDATYKFNYATTDIDAMINVINLISKKSYHPLNVYLIGGVGLNYAWGNEDSPVLRRFISATDSEDRLSHNFRIGTMLDYNIARNWSVNLELAANCLNDRYNSRITYNDDWQLTAQLGVTYKFGLPHKVKGNPNSNIIVDPATIGTGTETGHANTNVNIDKPAPAPTPTPTPAPTPVVKKEEITRNIFFEIRKTEVTALEQPKLAEVAKWLKEHPTAKVTVTGYADKGTGNSINNERFAKQRAENVTKTLIKKYGIEASRITTDSKGDREQPFAENDKNRVSIVIGKE